jgi:transposase
MKIEWKDPDDARRLAELVAAEAGAKQRDRYRVVLLAARGLGEQTELTRQQIADAAGRSRQFVDEWVGRYRKDGLDALRPRKQPGARPKLSVEEQGQLKAMLDTGPGPEEGLAAYNGPILREKIEQRFGKLYSLPGVYDLLHGSTELAEVRLGYNDLMPRPSHPGSNPAAQEEFKKRPCPRRWNGRRRTTRTGGY